MEASGNYVKINSAGAGEIIIRGKISSWKKVLPLPYFVVPHVSFIVNVHHVVMYEYGTCSMLTLTGGLKANVSRMCKYNVLKSMNECYNCF